MRLDIVNSVLSPPRLVVAAFELVLVLALASQCIRMAWIIYAPMEPPSFETSTELSPVRNIDFSVLTRVDPFNGETATELVEVDADIGLTLFGIRMEGDDFGAAIIRVGDAEQAIFAIGEEITEGVILTSVAADHVILERGRNALRLGLNAFSQRSEGGGRRLISSPSPPATPSNVVRSESLEIPEIDPVKFLAEASFHPRMRDGEVTGYTLLPRGNSETLRDAGLVEGDVLVGVNGNQLTAENFERLKGDFQANQTVQLTVERDARTRMITLQLGGEAQE